MKRLRMLVEGQTEEKFVTDVLTPYLAMREIFVEPPVITWTSRDGVTGRKARGGVRRTGWERVRDQMARLMREDHDGRCLFSTMFDFYGFPENMPHDPLTGNHVRDVVILEDAFRMGVEEVLRRRSEFVRSRFIPFIMLHEFEAFVFVDPQSMDWEYIDEGDQAGIEALKREATTFDTPESINQGTDTAPSKRILKRFPSYDKVTKGNAIVSHIGIERLLAECPHFRSWVERLVALDLG